MSKFRALVAAVAAASLVAGCGGGGGGGGTSASASPQATAGFWDASAGAVQLAAVMLPDGTVWMPYAGGGRLGLIQGTVNGGVRDYPTTNGFLVSPQVMTMTATAQPRLRIQGSIDSGGTSTAFSGTYDRAFEATPTTAGIAGTYAGAGAFAGSAITVAAGGAVTGNILSCTFTGTVKPRTDSNTFDLAITFASQACALDGTSMNGLLGYGAEDGSLFAAALTPSGTGVLFIGVK